MRTRMHYLVAVLAACVIVVLGIVFVRQTWSELRSKYKVSAARQKFERTGGQLTPAEEAELDAEFERGNFQMTLPSGFQVRLDLARFLEGLWYVWVPLIFAICLGAAALYGWIRGAGR